MTESIHQDFFDFMNDCLLVNHLTFISFHFFHSTTIISDLIFTETTFFISQANLLTSMIALEILAFHFVNLSLIVLP